MGPLNKPHRSHHGKNTSKIRSLRSVKQEALAAELGVSQQEISRLEQLEEIEVAMLEKIAIALNVTTNVIKSFDGNTAFYTLNNNTDYEISITQHFSPEEKIIELYERLLQSEKEKLDILQKNTQNRLF